MMILVLEVIVSALMLTSLKAMKKMKIELFLKNFQMKDKKKRRKKKT